MRFQSKAQLLHRFDVELGKRHSSPRGTVGWESWTKTSLATCSLPDWKLAASHQGDRFQDSAYDGALLLFETCEKGRRSAPCCIIWERTASRERRRSRFLLRSCLFHTCWEKCSLSAAWFWTFDTRRTRFICIHYWFSFCSSPEFHFITGKRLKGRLWGNA